MNMFEFIYDNNKNNDHRIYGVTIGVVSNNKDPEKMGRVKIKLPTRLGEKETDWARIATIMSGKEMGVFFFYQR